MSGGPTAEEIAKAMVAEQKAEKQREGKRVLKGCLIVVLLFVGACGVLVIAIANTEPVEWTGPSGSAGGLFCKGYARTQLKSPSTADFPWGVIEAQPAIGDENKPTADQTWVVRSYVDSQNGFGAVVRTQYSCDLKPPTSAEEDWEIVNFWFSE
jgi:hypothetical protein